MNSVVNFPVLKAFLFDTVTSLVTLGLAWATLPDNLAVAGVSDYLIPIVAAVAGGLLLAWRRLVITKKEAS